MGNVGEPASVATSYRSRAGWVLSAFNARAIRTAATGIGDQLPVVEPIARCVTLTARLVKSKSGWFSQILSSPELLKRFLSHCCSAGKSRGLVVHTNDSCLMLLSVCTQEV
jgi:hypothetical protein